MESNEELQQGNLFFFLNLMRDRKMFTDILFTCAGGELEAHRVILSARSLYFQKMLLSDFEETVTKNVDFSHIDINIMRLILDYIYLNSLKNIPCRDIEALIKLVQVSHLFELTELYKHCWNLIMKRFNVENWLDIWKMAILYGGQPDVYKVLYFIFKNLPEIVTRIEFLSLSRNEMLVLLQRINENHIPIEDHLLEGLITWSKTMKINFQELIPYMNFDFISQEYMGAALEREGDLFSDKSFQQFFKQQIVPRLKSKSDNEGVINNFAPKFKINLDFSLKFFFFGYFERDVNGCLLYEKAALRIFDSETKSVKCIDKLPFLFGNGIIPIQYGSDIYIIGGIPDGVPEAVNTSSLLKSFSLYDWKTNSIIRLPPLLEAVADNGQYVSVYFKNCLYFIPNNSKLKNRIQHFSIDKRKWFLLYNILQEQIVTAANLKGTLYLLCWNNGKIYTLYTFNNNRFMYHSHSPIEASVKAPIYADNLLLQGTRYSNRVHHNLVTVYKDNFFIFGAKNDSYYVFNPETQLWNTKKINVAFARPEDYISFAAPEKGLMFYNKMNRRLFWFDETTTDLKKMMTAKGPLDDDPYLKNLGFRKFEYLLISVE